jgi:hypothetical protein
MAVIGHAEVIVKAITTGFEDSIRNDLKRISGSVSGRRAGESLGSSFTRGFESSTSGNIFGQFAQGLESMAPNAEAARLKFQSLVRVGYVVQGVLGLVGGAVSSVAVSLGTLVGVLGKAAPAVGVLANAFVVLRVAMATAKFGFGDIGSAVKAATAQNSGLGKSIAEINEEWQQLLFTAEEAQLSEGRAALNLEAAVENFRRTADLPPNSAARREAKLAMEEAELSYRRAKDRTQDLTKEVEKGKDALNDSSSGTDPFADLNEAQKTFAQKLVELKPLLDALELDVSRALLPPISRAIDLLVKDLLPILNRRLPAVAGQVGDALESMVNSIDMDTIDSIFKGMLEPFQAEGRSNIQLFGDLLNNVLDIFLKIVEATGPLLNTFLTFLVEKTEAWITSLESSDVAGFFADAGGYAADLGEIIGNVFDGLNNLIGLTTGPGSAGDDMVQWMKDSTETFSNMFSEDPEAGKTFFKDAFANARSVMSSIGALLMEIFKLADKPEIKEAFDALKEGAPAMGDMLGKMVDAAPSFATFLATVTEIINELTDSDQISAFFDTLNDGALVFKDFIQSDSMRRLLDNLGPIFATLSAIGIMFDVIKFAANVALGYIIFATNIIGNGMFNVKNLVSFLGSPKGLGKLATLLKGGGIIGLIAIMIAKTVEFYDKFSDFKEMVDNVFQGVKDSFSTLMEAVGGLFDKLFGEGEGSLLSALDPVIKIILEILIPALGVALEVIINLLTFVVDMASSLLDWIIPVLTTIADGISLLFEGDVLGFFKKMVEAFGLFFVGMFQFVVNGVIDLANLLIRTINTMVGGITNGKFGQFMKDVLGIDLSGFKIPEIANVTFIADQQNRNTNKRLREGTTSFGGADRRAMGSVSASGITGMAERNMGNMDSYKESRGSGSPITVNINPSAGMSEAEIGKIASREIASAMRKGTI